MPANISDVTALAAAFASEADIAAKLTIGYIKAAQSQGLLEPDVALPPGFLLELGAVLRLHLWEIEGTLPMMAADLPLAADAHDDLLQRLAAQPESFRSCDTPLLRRVLDAAIRNLGWGGLATWGRDVVVAHLDDRDEVLDALAMLLWSRRSHA